jgi:hypothetical protein
MCQLAVVCSMGYVQCNPFVGYSACYFLQLIHNFLHLHILHMLCGWIVGENERHLIFVYCVYIATADRGNLDSTSYKLNSPSQFYQFSR